MIARVWHGVVREEKSPAYIEYLRSTGIPDYLKTNGNRGVVLFRRVAKAHAHFLLISYWESLAAVHHFAGPDIEQARYYPQDSEFLIELEPTVAHYEVIADLQRCDTGNDLSSSQKRSGDF
jgi:heme-degrading monooxygenase HmoA